MAILDKSRRRLWIMLQVLIIAPFMFTAMTIVEMTFAEPGGAYVAESGQKIRCEALARSGRSLGWLHCATFGSKETNPRGFLLAITTFTGLSALLWWSSRPGRGLRFSKEL